MEVDRSGLKSVFGVRDCRNKLILQYVDLPVDRNKWMATITDIQQAIFIPQQKIVR